METAHNGIKRQPLAVSCYNTILAYTNRTTYARVYEEQQNRNKRARKCEEERRSNTVGLITQTPIILTQTTVQALKPSDSQKLTPSLPHKRLNRE